MKLVTAPRHSAWNHGLRYKCLLNSWMNKHALIATKTVKRLGQLDDLTEGAHRAVTLLLERRTALISAAVTGKIDVRAWQPPVVSELETTASAVTG